MKHLRNLILSIVVVGSIFGISLLAIHLSQNSSVPGSNTNQTEEQGQNNADDTEITPVAKEDFVVSGWIPDWGSPAGLASLKANDDLLTNISPVWYEVAEDGSIKDKTPANSKQIIAAAQSSQIEITPTVASFDHNILSKVFQDEAVFNRHLDQLKQIAARPEFAGIDLDYESTKLADKDQFYKLLDLLSKDLKAKGKRLIFTALAQWGDTISYKSLRETRQVQNWAKISEYADEIRVMAYDYTSPKALQPGPIAPYSWVKEVLEYAREEGVISKLVLGIHLYSYEWYMESSEYQQKKADGIDPLAFSENSDFNLPISKTSARSYTYDTVKKLVGSLSELPTERDGEMTVRFMRQNPQTKKNEERILVYTTPAATKAKVDLARSQGAKGVVFWRLGGDEDLLSQININ
jgi:spore germination protein YaaH